MTIAHLLGLVFCIWRAKIYQYSFLASLLWVLLRAIIAIFLILRLLLTMVHYCLLLMARWPLVSCVSKWGVFQTCKVRNMTFVLAYHCCPFFPRHYQYCYNLTYMYSINYTSQTIFPVLNIVDIFFLYKVSINSLIL